MDKLNLNSFLNEDDYNEAIKNIDPELLKARYERSKYRQLVDIWGEADSVISIWKKWKNNKKNDKLFNELIQQLESFHRTCCIIYTNKEISDGLKWELKIAEWELYDFILWGNEWKNDSKSVMLWFDQWCYDLNFNLL